MKTSILHSFLCASFVVVGSLCTTLFAQDDTDEVIIYVDASKSNSAGGNNEFTEIHNYGKDWNTAFRYLHDALRFGDPNATQIWIAEGHYYVDRGVGVEDQTTGEPDGYSHLNPFLVNNWNLKIYGGFSGTETSLDERDSVANPTYLDGNVYYKDAHDFTVPNDLFNDDNQFSKRVMVVYNSTLTLDGLVFQYVKGGSTSAGNSSLAHTERDIGKGAFILANQSSLTINNCLFQYAVLGHGGQMIYARHSTAPIRIRNSRFADSGRAANFISARGDDYEKVIVENTVFENLYRNEGSGDDTSLFDSSEPLNVELRNSLLYNNDYLQIIKLGAYMKSTDPVTTTIENVLVLNNNVYDKDLIVALGHFSSKTINFSLINSSFINNISSSSIISTNERTDANQMNLSLHNNVFYGNRTTDDGSTLTEILKTGPNQEFLSTSVSHNATDNSNSKLITNADYNDGAIDLSGASSLADLFVGTTDTEGNFDADGADDIWFTADDGFVPIENGLLHNVGHNDAVTNINLDIKGDARVQDSTVDIGAYEHGEEEGLSVDGLSSIEALILYPNPIRSSQEGNSLLGYLVDPSSKPTRLVLRDLGGKLVRDLPIEDSGKGIELGVLQTGTYLAILSTENKGYKSFKLVVE